MTAKPRHTEIIPTEYEEACAFVDWLELQKQAGKILDYCHIANESYGGKREDMLRGAKLKRVGRKRGVFDYEVFVRLPGENYWTETQVAKDRNQVVSRDHYCLELRIELKKRKGGTISNEQRYWQEVYKQCGIPAVVCHGAIEAIEYVKGFTTERKNER